MPPKHILEMKSVTKRFGDVLAVRKLSLQLAPGEIYGLIGPNGSGKTTTLKMIAGLYQPTSGSIKVNGFDITSRATRAKRHIGYIPDEPTAYDRLSGREFLEFVGRLWRLGDSERNQRISELLAAYGIERLAEAPFGNCSRGTKQKISTVAALLHRPELILIDEPMVGLDPASAQVTKRLLREAAKVGATILISTHTLSVAEELCQHFGVLAQGRLLEQGTLAQLAVKAKAKGAKVSRLPDGQKLEAYYLALTGEL
jgi:ABC-2 type transport system ATP-binding protein